MAMLWLACYFQDGCCHLTRIDSNCRSLNNGPSSSQINSQVKSGLSSLLKFVLSHGELQNNQSSWSVCFAVIFQLRDVLKWSLCSLAVEHHTLMCHLPMLVSMQCCLIVLI
ncbi:uncharacterized protein LOC124192817 [Daphnia pulex]|uniref:uncharacterized protein LOC124192817 n=1 Tax=Daphnia pulex TaxID=6669 RepID=UPI001EDF4122|nr:uncharacterized protein LOC124192817 [Daphnia pulex]